LLASAPLIAIGLAVGGLAYIIATNWDFISTKTNEIWNGITKFFTDTWNKYKTDVELIFGGIKKFFEGFADMIIGGFTGDKTKFENGFKTMLSGIEDIFKGVMDLCKTAVTDAIKFIFEKIDEAKKKIGELKDTASNKITEITGGVVDKKRAEAGFDAGVKGLFNGLTFGISDWAGIGKNATGTDFWRGGLTQVNEKGGEIMNLPRGTQIIPHDVSMEMARNSSGGSSAPTINIGGISLSIGAMMGTEKQNREIADQLGDAFIQALAKRQDQLKAIIA
jgi:phage-related protein